MEIKKYKKIGKNSYKLILENEETLTLYDEVILKYQLLLKKDISISEIKNIKKENEFYTCYYKALSYLNYKSCSKKELGDYLKKRKFTSKDIARTLQILEEKKILNDELYFENIFYNEINFTTHGPKKIEKKLLDLGFKEEKIKEKLNTIKNDIWLDRLKNSLEKRVKTNKKDGSYKIKEKLMLYALNEGYKKEDALYIIENLNIVSTEGVLEKEAIKLYKKYSLKYQGEELLYQIKVRMFRKGFSYEEIDSILVDIKKEME